ncbi:response regulator [Pleurocapsales cyanobacterium LEGE 06147]|nr:response regulator [Pleurocapsales cyanobacterium LEGE 06147]
MKHWQQSLTTKITNYFLLLALITVGIVGGVAYFQARKALQQAAFERLRVAATLKEGEITRWFEDQQRDFLLITELPDIRAKLQILCEARLLEESREAYQVLSRYFQAVIKTKPSLGEIFILDRRNKIILSTNQQREGEYEILANITYVEQVELEDNFAPIFYVSPVTGEPTITLAKPLVDSQGVRQGIILVEIDLDRIDRIVRERTGLGDSGETYLVGSLVSKNAFISGNSERSSDYPDGVSSPGIDAAMSGSSGYGRYHNYAGVPVLGVYRWLNDRDIALMIEIGQEEAFAPARQLASTIVAVGLLSVLGLLIGINWLSRQLSLSRQKLEDYSHQLEVKAREAEAASRSKSLFLANMSHELRTPLNAILGFAQLLERDTTATANQKEAIAIINRSGEHLLNLIDDVLEMSKIEAGKTTLNPESFDLYSFLQTIKEMFQMRAESKQLAFNLILAEELPRYIYSDRRKLRQVLLNLLSNAIKFTNEGSVTLKVSSVIGHSSLARNHKGQRTNERQVLQRDGAYKLLRKPQETAPQEPRRELFMGETPKTTLAPQRTASQEQITIHFEVSDTGQGIAPEELDKLFKPFSQTASGIASEGGTGLGLSISRQFVQLMGGEITATSILGRGSTFAFNVRVSLVQSDRVKSLAEERRVEQIAPDQPQYRILVVDDMEANRQLLLQLLQTIGFDTRSAKDGREAISLWETWQPHLIWMDMRMPVMDGYSATQYIKSQPQGKDTIIIALTASAFEEQRAKILTAGCDDFVRKPFQERVIFEKIAQYLGVKYLYNTDSFAVSDPVINSSLDSLDIQDLSSLPEELCAQLHQAAIAVDAEQIEQLIDLISPEHHAIVQALIKIVRNYDFDTIIKLTEPKSNR